MSGDEKDDLDLQFDPIEDVMPASYEEMHHNLPTPVQHHHNLPPVHAHRHHHQQHHQHQQYHPHDPDLDQTLQEIQDEGLQDIGPIKAIDQKRPDLSMADENNADHRPGGHEPVPAAQIPAPPVVTVTQQPNADVNVNERNVNTPLPKACAIVEGMTTSPIKRFDTRVEQPAQDPVSLAQQSFIEKSKPTTELEIVLTAELRRKNAQIGNLTNEIVKLKQFVSKRKQTYKRKRKEFGAPKRALSAYNIFIQDRFKALSKENQDALTSTGAEKTLIRVKPENLVAKTGNEWKLLSKEEKKVYQEMAKEDKKRWEEEVRNYNPPEPKQKRRNKTGYNLFFTSHVSKMKENDTGVPGERGSVARVVGNAWKELAPENRQYFEEEAEKINGTTNSDNELDEGDDEKEFEEKRDHLDYEPAPPGHMMMPPHAPIVHHHNQHGPRAPYAPPPPGYYPFPYEFYPMPYPPPGKGEQGRHPAALHHHHPYPFPPPPYPPHPYHHPDHNPGTVHPGAVRGSPPRAPSPEMQYHGD